MNQPVRTTSFLFVALALACGGELDESFSETSLETLEDAATVTGFCSATTDDTCRQWYAVDGTAKVPLYRTYPLRTANTAVTSAIVVVHDSDRSARHAFAAILAPATSVGVAQSTLVIAPEFAASLDNPVSGQLTWEAHGWKSGDHSLSPKAISAFTVIDQLITLAADKAVFPNLTKITVVGNNGGGQFLHRYAYGARGPSRTRTGISYRYVVSAAPSFLYLNGQRRSLTDPTIFEVPNVNCAHNDYRYGLRNLNNYMSTTTSSQIKTWAMARKVTYLVGELDTATTGVIDQDCPAQVQGAHRLQRAKNHLAHLASFFPSHPHVLKVVPGVGPESDALYASPEGRATIFAP
jgi:hypothetical protein